MTRFEKETVFPLRFFYMSSNSLYLTLWLPVMTSYMYSMYYCWESIQLYNVHIHECVQYCIICEDSVLYVHMCNMQHYHKGIKICLMLFVYRHEWHSP